MILMGEDPSSQLETMLERLEQDGLLLESDPRLPSVVNLIVGEPVSGSWWGHARGHDIHRITGQLAAHEDVLVVKLLAGKTTYAHRNLWPAIFAVATGGEPWQWGGVTNAARHLFLWVDREGEVCTDQIPTRLQGSVPKPGDAARELERRLLVDSRQIHTETGAHAKILQTWRRWAEAARFIPTQMTVEAARRQLDEIVRNFNERFEGNALLPWRGR